MERFAAGVSMLTVLVVLLFAAAGHLARPRALAGALAAHRVLPERAAAPVAALVTLAELALAVGGVLALVGGTGIRAVLAGAAVLFGTYSAYTGLVLRSGRRGPCGCAGSIDVPLGQWVLVRALALAALALLGLALGPQPVGDTGELIVTAAAAGTFAVLVWQLPVALRMPAGSPR